MPSAREWRAGYQAALRDATMGAAPAPAPSRDEFNRLIGGILADLWAQEYTERPATRPDYSRGIRVLDKPPVSRAESPFRRLLPLWLQRLALRGRR